MNASAREANDIRLTRRTIVAPIPGLNSGMKSEGRKRAVGQPGDTLRIVETIRVGNTTWYRSVLNPESSAHEGYVIEAALVGQAHG